MSILQAARPRQWVKNLLLYAGFLFTLGRVPVGPAFVRSTIGALLFCCLSASAYLVNDVRDVESDRRHPEKRYRPIAAGRLSPRTAICAALILAAAGLAGSFALSMEFGALAAAYLAVTLAYSFALKHVVLLDVMALAAGYVIRALAGAAAVPVPASFFLALCTLLLALFLGLCKRRAELTAAEHDPTASRAILGEYSPALLDQMISVVTSSALLAYALYTYFTPTAQKPGPEWRFHAHLLTATIPFVVYGIYRYLYLVYQQGLGESPEAIFLKDRPLQWNTLLWAAACVAAVLMR
ncbi:MAG TPA: decaprenyl-phosphate phosphoribosyltransferase [Armatimonadota bacterium]|jgi:4-hydroxybenzoate polyprenyltransferase